MHLKRKKLVKNLAQQLIKSSLKHNSQKKKQPYKDAVQREKDDTNQVRAFYTIYLLVTYFGAYNFYCLQYHKLA